MKILLSLAPLAPLALACVAASISAPRQDDAPKPEPFTLTDVAWLAGQWRQATDKGTTDELWMPPAGGVMLGLNRSVRGKQPAAFEFLRLQQDDRGVVYLASPSGAEPTPFRMTSAEPNRAVFENPEHDFPKRIEYRRDGDTLQATISGDAKTGPTWRFERLGDVR